METWKILGLGHTVADTLAPTYRSTTSLRAGAAANKLEAQKRIKYKDLLPQFTFCAVGLETLGPTGTEAKGFFSELERHMTSSRLVEHDYVYLQQRLSLILMRSNAMSVLGTMTKTVDSIRYMRN